MTVGLVLVSHSRELADGSGRASPRRWRRRWRSRPAGGLEDGGDRHVLRTDHRGHREGRLRAGAVLLYDLGSGFLTAETALEFLDPEQAERVVIVDAPFVLGAVSAAIAAQTGGDLRAVIAAALEARTANGPGGVRSVDG